MTDLFNQSGLREVLLLANANADYDSETMNAQIEEMDLEALEKLLTRMMQRATVLAHAYDVMSDGTHKHPMQAFLHATECWGVNPERMSDSEFYHLFTVWTNLCAKCVKPGVTGPFSQADFAKQFMQGE